MKVLVASASRHGATDDIAGLIGSVLADRLEADGVVVDVRRISELKNFDGYDAVVLGSAVYMGRWLGAARGFAHQHASELARVPTWLFSSGPIGDPPLPIEESADSVEIAEQIRAREHVVFPGRLSKEALGLTERMTVKVVGAAYGDFRDPSTVIEWADRIATQLSLATSTAS